MQSREALANARRLLAAEGAAVAAAAGQLDEQFLAAAQLMLACQGKVLVGGAGTSHATACRMAHLLSCCGTPALFIHPGDAMHGASGAIAAGDVLVVISKGGETDEVIRVAQIGRERGARVIALTENRGSTVGKLADVAVTVQAPPEVDPYGMIATGSSLVYAAVCDALCVTLLEWRGYSREAFSRTHPGGAVGQRLRGNREGVNQ